MAIVYRDKDADLKYLNNKTVAVIGYGNQGRAQALNLRDAGVSVVVGCIPDAYRESAVRDNQVVLTIDEAVRKANIVMLLIPDEVQIAVYRESVAPSLKPGMTLSFASGYNIRFRIIVPPKDVDVIMLAPRTLGLAVRETYVAGAGVPADADVWQDYSGKAWQTVLALAKGIGCTRAGVFKSSFAEETDLDLFSEQALWPALLDCLLTAYEVLVEKGYSREAVVLELYASGEAADIFREMAKQGLFEQMKHHSPTSQYGVLSRRKGAAGSDLRKRMEAALEKIRDGSSPANGQRKRRRTIPPSKDFVKKPAPTPLTMLIEVSGSCLAGSVNQERRYEYPFHRTASCKWRRLVREYAPLQERVLDYVRALVSNTQDE